MVVEPDAEVVQSYPRCQTRSQTAQLVGAFPPQTEDVEELIVDTLHDLTDAGDPSPQSFRPRLATVTFRRMDYQRPVALLPATVVLGTLETLLGYE